MVLSIIPLNNETLRSMELSIRAKHTETQNNKLSIMTPSRMTFTILAFGIMLLNIMTQQIDIQNNET